MMRLYGMEVLILFLGQKKDDTIIRLVDMEYVKEIFNE